MDTKPILRTILLAVALSTTGAFAASGDQTPGSRGSAPFEQTQFDRTLPNVQGPVLTTSTTVVAAPATSGSSASANVWAHDHNFIAPAQ